MSRKLIIFICSLNVLLGAGVLWYVLTPHESLVKSPLSRQIEQATPVYTDAEIFDKASKAVNTRQALGYLSQLSENEAVLDQSAEKIEQLTESSTANSEHSTYLEALIQFHGSRAQNSGQLQPLKKIALTAERSLRFRDIAFRSYIQNFSRLKPAESDDAFKLIDALYFERNSLAGTSLQAEHFLHKNVMPRPNPENVLGARARETVLEKDSLVFNRIAAADILLAQERYLKPSEIRSAFADTKSERVQTALLRLYPAQSAVPEDFDWLKTIEPATPDQEQAIQSLLRK